MKPLLICFDWDGTLADSMNVCVIQIQKVLKKLNLEERPIETIMACNGPTYAQSVQILGIPEDMGERFLQERMIAEMEILKDEQKLFPGIQYMLEELSQKAKLAVVSNGLPDYLKVSMKLTGVEEYFECVEAMKNGRSKGEALRQVIQRYPEYQAVMVGDRLGDIQAGKENGIQTMAACYGYGHPEEYEVADIQVKTVEELKNRLNDMIESSCPKCGKLDSHMEL